jgi:chloride channel protein, CIC family
MTLGALLGAALAQGPTGSYAIVGSAAVLAAVTQAPLSAMVFVLELTRHASALTVPLLIAVAGATVTAHFIDPAGK